MRIKRQVIVPGNPLTFEKSPCFLLSVLLLPLVAFLAATIHPPTAEVVKPLGFWDLPFVGVGPLALPSTMIVSL